jgi:predicted nuclease of restriction endonuclease-like (RecB) superfamily
LGYLRVLIDQLKDREQREWYLRAAVEYGWGRNVLELQIKSGFREREGKAITNFHFQPPFPPPDSDLAEQVLRDPYNFDFLTDTREAKDGEIERGLLIHLRDLLLELGRGFAFVGSQVPLDVGDEMFYIDLLFYHARLHAYFVIERLCNRPHKSSMRTKQLERFKIFNGKHEKCSEYHLRRMLARSSSSGFVKRLDGINLRGAPQRNRR